MIKYQSYQIKNPTSSKKIVINQVEVESINGIQNVYLPAYLEVEGEIILRASLTYQFDNYRNPSLILQANHTFMTFYFDDKELYSVKNEPYSLGNYFAKIPLPSRANGEVLEIHIKVVKHGLSRIQVPQIIILPQSEHLESVIASDLPSLLVNLLILFSSFFMFIFAFMERSHENCPKMLLRGLWALTCAIYFMCETYTIVYLIPASRIIYILDMICFSMIMPILLMLISWDLNAFQSKLCKTLAYLGLVNSIMQIILCLCFNIELRIMLRVTHIIQLVGILLVIICIIYNIKEKNYTPFLYSMGIISLGGFVDLVLFAFEKNKDNIFFVKIAILFCMFFQILQFIRTVVVQSTEKAREEYYKMLALKDSLTLCYSRVAYEIDKKNLSQLEEMTILAFDLNNLKQTNDTYGHSEGDLLLQIFGAILRDTFESKGKCYRVGGDEFWVFCNILNVNQIKNYMNKMKDFTLKENKKRNSKVKISYAMGYATMNEAKGDLVRAIELADQRMYDNKRMYKSKHSDIY